MRLKNQKFFIPVLACIYRLDMFGQATAGHYTCRRLERHRSLRPVQTLDLRRSTLHDCVCFSHYFLSPQSRRELSVFRGKNGGSSGERGVPTNFRLT